ncbi:segregation and condensation protein A [Novispirillum itersonii]|uniref:Segregation and condensation protein A n=1 Tax=Novispirillum itersonii TaxID=189 RepID=A0A7W9ZH75_NOVIT|nr:ScpA family protein [Novispirillum itersonii]MBB6210039.1 segregation and condensation protein A [Novispirillum itersonii]
MVAEPEAGGAPLSFEGEAGGADPVHALVVNLNGYDGPIDVLLQLARDQKVDLAKISILHLAEQYLEFVAEARKEHLELAADYLVMAAWLAYLKSRLLLPPEPGGPEPSAEEMAAALQFQLQRLEAMQEAAQALTSRPVRGRDVFARGSAEGVRLSTTSVWDVTLYDLLKAYADHKRREGASALHIEPLTLFSVDEALSRLEALLNVGALPAWVDLRRYLPENIADPLMRRSSVCAHFIASLELAKQGRLDIRQEGGAYSPLLIRARDATADAIDAPHPQDLPNHE